MNGELPIDYATWFDSVTDQPCDKLAPAFGERFSAVWIDRYHQMSSGPTNVLEVSLKRFTYLFDFCSELIEAGELAVGAREDRALGGYGISASASTRREASRIRGFPVTSGPRLLALNLHHAAAFP